MQTLYGMKVVVNPNIPRLPAIQIDPKFEWCSDEFRAKHNAWLLERFGYVDQVLFMTEPFSGQQVVMMRPQHYAMLKLAAHNK